MNKTIRKLDISSPQGGFTLIEVLIAVTIIGLITAATMSAMGGGADTKATAIFSKMNEVANAVSIYKKNTGCVPSNVAVLFDKTLATAANNFCNANTTTDYGSQDYMSAMPPDGGTGVRLDQLGVAGATLNIRQNLTGTTLNNYALEVYNLGDNVQLVMSKCNGIDYSNTPLASLPSDFTNGNSCVYVGSNASVGMLISRF